MQTIRQQVTRARRRLIVQQFLRIVPWTLFVCLLVAVIGLSVPKIWAVEPDKTLWFAGWIGGALGTGLLAALLGTLIARRGMMDAAIEIDRRCGLKERVSSALSLAPSELESETAIALLDDAERRVERIEVRQAFPVRLDWPVLMPIVAGLFVFILVLCPDAKRDKASAALSDSDAHTRVKNSAEGLKKKLIKRQEEAAQRGLKEAEDLFKSLQDGVDELASKDDIGRQKALIKMNDLAKELAKRRNALGDPEAMRKQFERLKNIARGPAERVAESLARGDLDKALEELRKLAEQLQNNKLSEKDREKLAQQLKQIQQSLQDMVASHDQAKKELERQIQQKVAEGDLETAGRLQRKLDKLQQQDRQMQRMSDLASRFGRCSQALENGDGDSAASEMDGLAADLEELQAEMDELATISDVMDEIASAKSSMNCSQCDGAGCSGCQSDMYSPFGSQGNGMGDGLGEGQGFGYRPEQKGATTPFESRLRAKPKAGEAVRLGNAFGPNQSGLSQEGAKQEIISALSEDPDPLTDQRLPRSQQDHVRQYYQQFGRGE